MPVSSPDSALFWMFAPGNWEVLVKVLDGCASNGRYWILSAGATDVLTAGKAAVWENEKSRAVAESIREVLAAARVAGAGKSE